MKVFAERVLQLTKPLTLELQRRRATPPSAAEIQLPLRYVAALRRRALFIAHHLDMLRAIPWPEILDLGRPASDGSERPLVVSLAGCKIMFHHSWAVIDHAYIAFDGLIAGCVNLTDTFARAINLVYGLGEKDRRVNLWRVKELVEGACPIGVLLGATDAFDWWTVLRELRGTCQHADVEHTLRPAGALSAAAFADIVVPNEYALPWTPTSLGVHEYGAAAAARIERLMLPLIDAIMLDPVGAVVPK